MIKILMAGRDKASLSALNTGLAKNKVQLAWADTGSKGLSMIAERDFDLVITDENLGDMNGLQFIREVVATNPMINCAAVSSLMPDDFHETSEGLGILMQLPVQPGQEYAEKLLGHLKSIIRTSRPPARRAYGSERIENCKL